MGVSISNKKIAKGWVSTLICHSNGLVRLDSCVHESYPVLIHGWLFSAIITADSDLSYFKADIKIVVTLQVKNIHMEVL
jgi:hypothetical protein